MIELLDDEQDNFQTITINKKEKQVRNKKSTMTMKLNDIEETKEKSESKINQDYYDFDENRKCIKKAIQVICPNILKINTDYLRKIRFNHNKSNAYNENPSLFTNEIKNQKYSILTLIPFVILSQFSLFANQFYLILIISQFFEALKVGLIIGYVAPLVFVLIVTLIKEGYDDILRFIQDRIINNQDYVRIIYNKQSIVEENIKSKFIKIGDLIRIKQNQRIPADMIILTSTSEQVFIRTDQLDGETDWKLRKQIKIINQYFQNINDFLTYLQNKNKQFELIVSPPSKHIYEFQGSLIYYTNGINSLPNEIIKESISLENTAWANTVLASSDITGVVINIGKETKSLMNSNKKRVKFGMLDLEVNFLSKILFIMMMMLSLMIVLLKEKGIISISLSLFNLVRFIILFCAIIPIALRVNLDISKTVFSMNISNDKKFIPGAIARNSTIPEDLGRIEYIFSDKTGTLTKNEMVFKSLALEGEVFGYDSIDDIRRNLNDDFKKSDSPCLDLISIPVEKLFLTGKKIRRSKKKILRDTITAMALCNSVNVANNDGNNSENMSIVKGSSVKLNRFSGKINLNDNKDKLINEEEVSMSSTMKDMKSIGTHTPNYQASSPDEIALVKIASRLGCQLVYRDDKLIKIRNIISGNKKTDRIENLDDDNIESNKDISNNNISLDMSIDSLYNEEEYEILQCFPFSSETKRMGIILRNIKYDYIVFYLKGAENVLINLVKEDSVGIIKEHSENLASSGLRTLVFSFKLLSKEEYNKWNQKYLEALNEFESRNEKVSSCLSELESNMEFLGVTGVEDLLQENVAETIDNLRNAGIKIWMLTGDKVETATCISISTGIKRKNQNIRYIIDDCSISKIKNILDLLSASSLGNKTNEILIIEGKCLDVLLSNFEEQFFNIALRMNSVICCRCSPTQKSQIIKKTKKYTNKRLCAIGDGGNDVAMIQEADVGIGIVGKEGMQASLASDFSIETFKDLNYLLLWHGRISYKNSAKIAKFIMHRGMIISFIQLIFSLSFYYLPIPIFNGIMVLGYTSIYTNFPVISLIYDRDTNRNKVLKFPSLYKELQKGRELTVKSFLFWVFMSLFQASVIMIGTLKLFDDPNKISLKISTIAFSCLIIAEQLNIYTQINRLHLAMILSLIFSIVSYLCSLIFLKSILDVYYLNIESIFKICLLTIASWFPFYFLEKVRKICSPKVHEKINILNENNN